MSGDDLEHVLGQHSGGNVLEDALSESMKVLSSMRGNRFSQGAPTSALAPGAASSGAADAIHKATQELEKQREVLLILQQLQNPVTIREQVRIENERKAVIQQITDAERQRQNLLRDQRRINPPNEELQHLKDMRVEMDKQRDLLVEMDRARNPAVIRQQVDLEAQKARLARQVTDAERDRQNLLEQERRRRGLPIKSAEERGKEWKDFFDESKKTSWAGHHGPASLRGMGDTMMRHAMTGGDKTKEAERDRVGGKEAGMLATTGKVLGTMIGGPVGGAIGEEVAKKIPGMIAAPVKLASEALKGLGDTLKDLGGMLGPIDAGFGLMSKGIETFGAAVKNIPLLGEILGPAIDALAGIPLIFKDILNTLTQFGSVASPAAMAQINYAVKDVQGVIGQSFIPVMYLMRDAIRLVGDVFANLLPNTNEMYEAIRPLRDAFNDAAKEIREMAREFGPTVRNLVITTIRTLGNALAAMAKEAGRAAKALDLVSGFKGLRVLAGIKSDKDAEARSSTGAAAYPAKFSSIEDYQKQLQLSAFNETGPSMNSVPGDVSRIAGTADKISSILERLLKPLNDPLAVMRGLLTMGNDHHGARAAGRGAG